MWNSEKYFPLANTNEVCVLSKKKTWEVQDLISHFINKSVIIVIAWCNLKIPFIMWNILTNLFQIHALSHAMIYPTRMKKISKKLIIFPTYGNLIFNTWCIEEWLDFLPQLPPWPCAELKISTQGTLANGKSHTLFLQFLECLTCEVTTSPGLHPWHDTAKTFITEFFHLTQDTSTEEDLFFSFDIHIRMWIRRNLI